VAPLRSLARVSVSIAGDPARFSVFAIAYFLAILGLDQLCSHPWQLLLGALTWVVLLVACVPLVRERRAQVAGVVLVATCAEFLGSIVWGVYTYRLENLPMFVPPGHGLVFLLGLSLSQLDVVGRHSRICIGAVLVAAVGWGLLGVTAFDRTDLLGALGIVVFLFYMRYGPTPAIYAGVFVAVGLLEISGTVIGTWTWQPIVPGTGVPSGNPPSGAIAGYALFDICAMALAPWFLRLRRTEPQEVVWDAS
jgi:uncharacterized membrane protein YuzA (DUF378 family)